MSQSRYNGIIQFCRIGDTYGEFSNFAGYPIELDSLFWPRSEHYFQAAKLPTGKRAETIAASSTRWRRRSWAAIASFPCARTGNRSKDAAMRRALRAKFGQRPALRELLTGTGEATLVKSTRNDSYWADGGDGWDKNRLGQLLMQVRNEIR